MYIQIRLNEEFVKEHFYDKVLPGTLLADALKKIEKAKLIDSQSFVLTVRTDEKDLPPEDLADQVAEILSKAFGIEKEEAEALFEFFAAPDEAVEGTGDLPEKALSREGDPLRIPASRSWTLLQEAGKGEAGAGTRKRTDPRDGAGRKS